MPTYLLDTGSSVELPRKPLTITIVVEGPGAPDLQVKGGQGSRPNVIRPRRGVVVLPNIMADVTVAAVSSTGAAFPSNCRISVDASVEGTLQGDPERAVLSGVRIDGLRDPELLVLQPVGERIRVRAASVRSNDADLGPLANAARTKTASLLGVTSVAPTSAIDVVLAVDGSASFRRRLRDGSLAAMLSVLAGITSVIGDSASVRSVLVGGRPTWLPPSDVAHVAATLLHALANSAADSRFVPEFAITGPSGAGRPTVVYLLTDGVGRTEPSHGNTKIEASIQRHVIVLGRRDAWAAATAGSAACTVVDPGGALDALSDRLLARPDELHAVVEDLLQAARRAQDSGTERIAR